MAVQFILGGAGYGKTYYVNQLAVNMAKREPNQQIIVLVPEQFTMQTQKEMVELSDCKGIMNIDVQSFVRLAYRIFGETGMGNLPVLDDMGKTMVLRKVLTEKEKELQYFGKNIHKKGYISEIKSFLSELLQYSADEATIEQMEAASDQKPVLKMKLQDMRTIYKGFMEYLENHYITSEEVLEILVKAVPESQILKDAVIILDGYTGFTPIQYRLIGEMMRCCKDVYVTVTIDRGEEIIKLGNKHSLFYMSRQMMHKIRKIAQSTSTEVKKEIWTGENLSETRFQNAEGIGHLEGSLFRFPVRKYEKEIHDISIHLLKQPEQEISFLLSEIKKLCRDGNRYKDIAVVTGNMDVYGMIAKEAFEKSGIPCFIDQKKSILIHPFILMLDALLDVLISDFSYEAIIEYLRGRYSGFSREEIDILDNFLLASGVRGKKLWSQSWEAQYLFRVHRREEQEEKSREQINQSLNSIREKVWKKIEPLSEEIGKSKHQVREFILKIVEFMEEEAFFQKIAEDIAHYEKNSDYVAAKEYSQIYGIVIEVFDRLEELLGEEEMSLSEFKELLDTGFYEARVGVIPPGVDQVVVGDITRTRLSGVKYLFFLGANDSNIPQKSVGGGIISSEERNYLSDQDFELAPTDREKVFTEQFYLYLTLTKPSRHLYMCYSETGNDGVAMNAAYIVKRLETMFPKISVVVEEQCMDDEHILREDMGVQYMIQGIRNRDVNNTKWQELFRYYCMEPERKKEVLKLLQMAYHREGKSKISKKAAEELYRSLLLGSVSQLEKYASCAYSYFLKYGLGLNERSEHEVAFFDLGNIVHEALELYTKELIAKGQKWQDLSEEKAYEFADLCLDQSVANYKDGLLFDTERDTYLVTRLRRILHRTIWAITHQMKRGKFQSVACELKYEQMYGPIKLLGKIDRVDLCEEEKGCLISIVDYKTGKKEISLSDLYYGLQMQLIVYLKGVVQKEEAERKKMIIPAGILYYNVDDPILKDSIKQKNVEEALLKKLRMKGLINEDDPILEDFDQAFHMDDGSLRPLTESIVAPFKTVKTGELHKLSATIKTDDFKNLMDFSEQKIRQMGEKILNGEIEVYPYKRMDSEGKTACDNCPYHSVCCFDPRLAGQNYHNLVKMTNDDVMRKIKEEKEQTDGGEDKMDSGSGESDSVKR